MIKPFTCSIFFAISAAESAHSSVAANSKIFSQPLSAANSERGLLLISTINVTISFFEASTTEPSLDFILFIKSLCSAVKLTFFADASTLFFAYPLITTEFATSIAASMQETAPNILLILIISPFC